MAGNSLASQVRHEFPCVGGGWIPWIESRLYGDNPYAHDVIELWRDGWERPVQERRLSPNASYDEVMARAETNAFGLFWRPLDASSTEPK